MLVPHDFERFEYVSEIDGTRTRHHFGEQATDELEAQLRPFFSSITMTVMWNGAGQKASHFATFGIRSAPEMD